MKKISFFALALAAGLMMGCSDEVGNDVNPGGAGSATVGEGFMSVAAFHHGRLPCLRQRFRGWFGR